MKIAKREIAIIMVIIGVLAGFCTYRFYFSSKMDTVDSEKSQQASLQSQIDEINLKVDDEKRMRSQMTDWESEVNDEAALYDVAYTYEDGILYMKEIEDAGLATITSYTVGETGIAATVAGQGIFAGKIFNEGSTAYTFNYAVESYDALKTFIDYIVSRDNGIRALSSISFSVAADGSISGSVNMNIYTMSDGSTAYEQPVINDVDLGIDNIFGIEGTTEE
jgi:flagellar basal body-associated protein FliL